MKIKASWSQPIVLTKSADSGLIYEVDLDDLPSVPGVYIFGRKHGSTIVPIYIGETLSIRSRIKNHLNSLQLMRALELAPTGGRFLIYCTFSAKSAERAKKHVQIVEKALIAYAQGEGHVLFNKKGTKLPTDEISFCGNRTSEALAPRTMLVKRTQKKVA